MTATTDTTDTPVAPRPAWWRPEWDRYPDRNSPERAFPALMVRVKFDRLEFVDAEFNELDAGPAGVDIFHDMAPDMIATFLNAGRLVGFRVCFDEDSDHHFYYRNGGEG